MRAKREILDLRLADLMSAPAVTVTPETPIAGLTELFAEHGYNALPVVNEAGALEGLVSRLDLFKVYLLPYRRFIASLEDTWVESTRAIMTRNVVALRPSDPAIRAMGFMVDYRLRTIPIVEDVMAGAKVVGVVTRGDVARALRTS